MLVCYALYKAIYIECLVQLWKMFDCSGFVFLPPHIRMLVVLGGFFLYRRSHMLYNCDIYCMEFKSNVNNLNSGWMYTTKPQNAHILCEPINQKLDWLLISGTWVFVCVCVLMCVRLKLWAIDRLCLRLIIKYTLLAKKSKRSTKGQY